MERRYDVTTDYNFNNAGLDVYSDISYPYADRAPETQEYSLQDIEQKLGGFSSTVVDVNETNPDLLPSNSTRNMSYERSYESTSSAVKTGTKLNTRTKVAVAGYIAVVLALVLAVVFCSVAVSNSFLTAKELSAAYQSATEQISALQEELSQENYEELAERAIQLGYVDANSGNTQTYTKIETRPAQNFGIETNWFDSLCDWLSGVFGG